MDLSRRELLASAAASSTIGLSGCLNPEAQDIWFGDDEEDPEPSPPPDDKDYRDRDDNEIEDDYQGPFDGFCDTRFRVPKGGAVYFRESPEISDGETLEGIISDEDDETLEISYLNRVKYLSDGEECFDYSPGGFRDFGSGEWHTRCFEVIHEYRDSYLVETEAIKDVELFDAHEAVPICIYESDI